MKLSQLKQGYIIVGTSQKDDYVYAPAASTYTVGISNNGVLSSSGIAFVYVYGYVQKGQGVRSRDIRDGGTLGMGVPVSSGYSLPHLRIGTAVGAGRNQLIKVVLDIRYIGSQGDSSLGVFTPSKAGLVPRPTAISGRFLRDDGTWNTVTSTGNVDGGQAVDEFGGITTIIGGTA